MGCSILRWYKAVGEREMYPINSVIEGSITLIETSKKKKDGTYKVRIVTDELEKHQTCFVCAVGDHAKKVLEYEAEDQPDGDAYHYGLIIIKPGHPNLADSSVVDFISFHRHPEIDTEKPTASRYGISVYNEVFHARARRERVLKKLDDSKRTKAKQSARKITREGISKRDVETRA